MKTITVQGHEFEIHDDGMVAIPEGDAMSAGSILPLSVLREFVRRAKRLSKKAKTGSRT